MNFKILKESLINCPALGCSNYQLPFFLFVYEKEENVLGVLTQKHEDNHQPIGYYSQQVDPIAKTYPPCLRAIPATAPLVKVTEEIVMISSPTIPAPHAAEAPNCNCTHPSRTHLISYEILLLCHLHHFCLL